MSASDRDKPAPDGADEAETGGFLSRWSRRKAELRRQDQASPAESEAESAAAPEAEIDPATLPSIESLTAESDFSLFLRKGVPAALRTAALRKLWLVEPSVVNYQALVEYNWDFTAPGYGELLPSDDMAKLARHVFSGFSQDAKAEDAGVAEAQDVVVPEQLPAPEDIPLAQVGPVPDGSVPEPAQARSAEQPPEQPPGQPGGPRRRHGGALPS